MPRETSSTASNSPVAGSGPASGDATTTRAGRGWLWSLLGGLVILGGIAAIPTLGSDTLTSNWTIITMYIVLAQSWNFIGGFTGYSAFGNVTFFGIGAYAVAVSFLSNPKVISPYDPQRPQQFFIGLLAGVVISAIFAFLIGLPTLRLKGHYFAIATLGTSVAVEEIVTQRDVAGSGGLASPPFPPLSLHIAFYYGFVALALVCLLLTTWLARSKFGYALVAIRENEQAAQTLGIATTWYKVGAYVLSAIPTAIAGGIYAYYSSGFEPATVFTSSISVTMVLVTFLGGSGTVLGPIIGAIIFEYASQQFALSSGQATSVFGYHFGSDTLLGVAIIIVAIALPQGLVRVVQEFTRRPVAGGAGASGNSRANQFVEGVRRVRKFIAANGI